MNFCNTGFDLLIIMISASKFISEIEFELLSSGFGTSVTEVFQIFLRTPLKTDWPQGKAVFFSS